MSTQTSDRATRRPLNIAYRDTTLAPGFHADASLDLQYLGGRTLAHLSYANVYLGHWKVSERQQLDRALAAAMTDAHLNNVLAQYFPHDAVTAAFAGPRDGPAVEGTVTKDDVEQIVARLGATGDVLSLLLPRGAVLAEDGHSSKEGLGGFHGSVHLGAATVYYAVAVYSEDGNGIGGFSEPWQNVCATLYHELQETRTDPDVEDAIRAGNDPDAQRFLGWYSQRGGEIGDIPIAES
ncbi:MAG: hypothetical protein ACYDCH_15770, partial [Gaiellaceae bacterium]